MKKCDFLCEDFVFKSMKKKYICMHMRESFFILEGKAVYVITLTFCHLLIDSPVTRQKG